MTDERDGFSYGDREDMLKPVDTTFDLDELTKIADKVTTLPEDLKFIRKVHKIIKMRRKMYFDSNELDWGMAEILAYGSLLKEGHDVHLSGQDSERGTFSHRHAVLQSEDGEDEAVLLNHLNGKQGEFYIYRSEEHTSELQSRFDLVC